VNPSTFCVAPWVHANVTNSGMLRPCCVSKHPIDHPVENFDQWWNGDGMCQLRQDLITGVKNAGCNYCWEAESQHRPSLRQNYNNLLRRFSNIRTQINHENHNVPWPTTLEIDIGNTCNIKCIMCWPHNSDKIQTEVLHNRVKYQRFPTVIHSAEKYQDRDWPNNNQDFFDKIAPNLKWLKIQGGEALTVKNIRDFLEKLTSTGIELAITTNGTVLDQRLIDTLSEFSRVTVSVSIEAANTVNDVIRYGSQWPRIQDTIDKLHQLANVEIQINHVLQLTSVFFLPGVIEFAENNNFHLAIISLENPKYLSLKACPSKYLKDLTRQVDALAIVNEKNQYIKQHIKTVCEQTVFDPELWKEFNHYIDTLDAIRVHKLRPFLPFDTQ
jgi:molybdenum cofactor biosynthesis enzyme MoaA